MNVLTKLAFGGLILGAIGYAQTPSESATPPPATSAMVSSSSSANAASSASGSASANDSSLSITAEPDAAPDPNIKPLAVAEPEPRESSESSYDIVADPASLLPDLPGVPSAKATLIGGTLERLDRVRDQITIRVFGGGRMNVLFDPRTHVYEGKTAATIADLRQGERIYLDTILDGDKVFARNIRIKAVQAVGESQGVVVRFRSDELTLRDAISPNPVRIRLMPSTQFTLGNRVVAAGTVREGSVVAIKFSSQGGGHDVAQSVSILALPGTRYTFAGQIVHIDLRTGLLVLNSSTDGKTYEIYLDPSSTPDDNLHVGSVVTVVTDFDGSKYMARSLQVNSPSQ